MVIFIDEVDALATSREGSNMHEATRRMLSVILQHIEGFASSDQGSARSSNSNDSIMVCATNRKQDLDAALMSRFDQVISYIPGLVALLSSAHFCYKEQVADALSNLAINPDIRANIVRVKASC